MSVKKLREEILPAIFSKGDVKYLGCSLYSEYNGGDQFQSNVIFISVTVQEGEETRTLPLVVKFEPFDKEIQKQLNTPVQFHNEVKMYSVLLPFLDQHKDLKNVFPKFYFGVSKLTDPDSDVIVIEDLRLKGFKLAEQRAFLDYDHLKLAMEKLGRFHALSYVAKKESPEEFYLLAESLKEPTWRDDSTAISSTIKHCFHRALDPLISEGRHSAILTKLLSRVKESVTKFLQELVNPEEPLAVICHGDFCRNNMLFKYAHGKPVDVRFFDIATSRYTSPVIDIAYLIFMNSSKEIRIAHWDDLLAAYHESLTLTLGDIEGPLLQQLHQEMKLKGVYGFVHASFFLPMMMFENDFTIDQLTNLTPDELGMKQARIGGDEGTRLLTEMVEELVERECLSPNHMFLK